MLSTLRNLLIRFSGRLRSHPTLIVCVLLALVTALLGLALWYSPRGPEFFGTTRGVIVVDSPEIFSRERLVNDRFKQVAWLNQELEKADKLEWGLQGDIKTSATTTRSLAVTGSVSVPGVTASAPLQPNGAARGPSVTQSDGTTKNPDAARQHIPADTPGADVVNEHKSGVVAAPIDQLHDKMAYRDEVRTAAMETQLDDRHDIAGNTLYRTKFSVTVFPEHDTSAWAVVFAKISRARPDSLKPTPADIYREWLEYYQDQLNGALDRMAESVSRHSDTSEFDLAKFIVFIEGSIRKRLATKELLVALILKKQAVIEQRSRDLVRDTCAHAPADTKLLCLKNLERPLDRYGLLDALVLAYRDTLPDSERGGFRITPNTLTGLIADYLIDDLHQKTAHQKLEDLWTVSKTGCDSGLCRIKLVEVPSGAKALADSLEKEFEVFSYAVVPKEVAQSLSNLRAVKQVYGSTIQGTARTQSGMLGAAIDANSKDETMVAAILRKPLIVGFSQESSKEGKEARFGWMFGPKFAIDEKRGVRFRHTPFQSDVSAVISVPSWWRQATASVTSCWIDDREVERLVVSRSGFSSFQSCQSGSERLYTIRLPGGVTEIARKIGLEVVRRPSVIQLVSGTVKAGEPAEFMIMGNHLWRSTVVLLDGQAADQIVVLPNMRGIVARFHSVRAVLPSADENNQMLGVVRADFGNAPALGGTARLWVWTSEGSQFAGSIRVLPATDKGKKEGTVDSPAAPKPGAAGVSGGPLKAGSQR
jgi:hypothetical protein